MTLRLYTSQNLRDEKQHILLDERAFHHAIHVMRLKKGDTLNLFNEQDGEWAAKLNDMTKKQAHVDLEKKIKDGKISDPLHLYFSPIKGDRQSLLIEKATELGVTDFFPVDMAHTQIHRINAEKLFEIALGAAQQCERMDIPRVHTLQKLSPALNTLKNDVLIVGMERSHFEIPKKGFCEAIKKHHKILIGPEGGFSDEEKRMLLSHPNIISLSLGENILRAETAGISMLSIIQFLKLYS